LEKLIIQGGNRLEGRVRVSSANNAVLPIIAGTLLASTPSKLLEIPNLEDVGTICQVIESLGVKITRNNADGEIVFDASTLTATEAPYELVRKMRASFLVMGPLLARKGEAKISMPGGCAIGARPIDLHLKAFYENQDFFALLSSIPSIDVLAPFYLHEFPLTIILMNYRELDST